MKKIMFLAAFALGVAGLNAQTAPVKNTPAKTESIVESVEIVGGPIMTLKSTTVDYGTIAQHSEPLRTLEFTNTGTEPLIIKSARGSCGCTVPTTPKEPIMPGETSKIEIRYATNRLGKFSKTVTLNTNQQGDAQVIKVVGMVEKTEESESVPKAPAGLMKKSDS